MQARVKKALPGVACLLLLAGALLLLASPRTISGDPTGAVPLVLPDELGPWRGENMLFCTSDQCGRSYLERDLLSGGSRADLAYGLDEKMLERANGRAAYHAAPTNDLSGPVTADACPFCGSPLSTISVGEQTLLPEATPIFRKLYVRPGHPDITATVVFSGMERRSIHRPQVCLVGQGNKITGEYTYEAKIGPDETFPVRVLEISRPVRNASGEVAGHLAAVYAYWLFNPERETDSHLVRFLHMTIDNVLRSYRPRWGYASIAIPRDPARPDAWKGELDSFLARFRPVITQVRADLDANRDRTLVLRGGSASANRYEGDGPTSSAPAARTTNDE